jgi:hypothetical protein
MEEIYFTMVNHVGGFVDDSGWRGDMVLWRGSVIVSMPDGSCTCRFLR